MARAENPEERLERLYRELLTTRYQLLEVHQRLSRVGNPRKRLEHPLPHTLRAEPPIKAFEGTAGLGLARQAGEQAHVSAARGPAAPVGMSHRAKSFRARRA